MAESKKTGAGNEAVGRREFLAGGAAFAAGALTAAIPEPASAQETQAFAPSKGYIVYDSRLCLGCQSCMFACSMANHGEGNPSLARIQVIRDAPSFTKYPYDIVIAVCRQCVTPLCVQNCPTGACHIDAAHGNVRRIDESRCIGCKRCLDACPFQPHRTVWNSTTGKSVKCDLCSKAPYWDRQRETDVAQACVSSCPAQALKLISKTPSQKDVAGYDVDLAPPPVPKPYLPIPTPETGS